MAKNKQFTTWEGLAEHSFDFSTFKKYYCIAKSSNGAREEITKQILKENPRGVFGIVITEVKISDPDSKIVH